MKLLIVRHGDPDYDIDSLTEKGWKEAEYLSERLSKLDVRISMYRSWKGKGYSLFYIEENEPYSS